MISDFLTDVLALKNAISKNRSVNVNSKEIKEEAVKVAKAYFSVHLSELEEQEISDDNQKALSSDLQDLIRLTHGNNAKASYLRAIKKVERACSELSVKEVSATPRKKRLKYEDQLIVSTLKNISPNAAISYSQALADLHGDNERVSFKGTAAELREALRMTMDHLAPDAEVEKQPGFKPEPDLKKPSMKQKVKYILKSREYKDAQIQTSQAAVEAAEDGIAKMARATYDRASLSTHVQTNKEEVLKVKRFVDTVLYEILAITPGV